MIILIKDGQGVPENWRRYRKGLLSYCTKSNCTLGYVEEVAPRHRPSAEEMPYIKPLSKQELFNLVSCGIPFEKGNWATGCVLRAVLPGSKTWGPGSISWRIGDPFCVGSSHVWGWIP